MQECDFRPKKWLSFPVVKVVYGQIRRQGALTHSNVPTKFRWNNQTRLGEKRKSVIFKILSYGRHFAEY